MKEFARVEMAQEPGCAGRSSTTMPDGQLT